MNDRGENCYIGKGRNIIQTNNDKPTLNMPQKYIRKLK